MKRTACALALGGLAALALADAASATPASGIYEFRVNRMVVSAQIESFGSLTRAEDLILSCGGEQTADPGELTIGGRTVQVGGPFVPIAGDTITASVPWGCVPSKAPAGKPRFVAVLESAHRPTRLPLPTRPRSRSRTRVR